jgi:hypothetical protein
MSLSFLGVDSPQYDAFFPVLVSPTPCEREFGRAKNHRAGLFGKRDSNLWESLPPLVRRLKNAQPTHSIYYFVPFVNGTSAKLWKN